MDDAPLAWVRLRVNELDLLMRTHKIGGNGELARRMGTVSKTTVYRARRDAKASEAVIAGMFIAFDNLKFPDLFEIVRSDGSALKVAA